MKNIILDNAVHRRRLPIEEVRQNRGWRLWLIPKPFDWVTTLLYLSGFAIFLDTFFGAPVNNWVHLFLATLAVLSLLAIDRLEFWFYGEEVPNRVALSLLLGRLVIVVLASFVPYFDISYILYAALPLNFALYFGMPGAYWSTGIFWSLGVVQLFLTEPLSSNPTDRFEGIIVYTMVTALVLALARVITAEKELRLRAEQMLEELGASHRQIVELATNEERVRLARDIHDSLGHYLTVVNVQLEKTIAFHEREPAEALRAAEQAKRLAAEALQEVRRSVKTLRTDEETFSLVQALERLIENMPDKHLKMQLFVHGTEQGYSSQKLLELFRVGQEGLTNIQRHAGAKRATLRLDFGQEVATLTLQDDGRGFNPKSVGHNRPTSYGLVGLQERLEALGGEFQISSQIGTGTTLTANVPKNGCLR